MVDNSFYALRYIFILRSLEELPHIYNELPFFNFDERWCFNGCFPSQSE